MGTSSEAKASSKKHVPSVSGRAENNFSSFAHSRKFRFNEHGAHGDTEARLVVPETKSGLTKPKEATNLDNSPENGLTSKQYSRDGSELAEVEVNKRDTMRNVSEDSRMNRLNTLMRNDYYKETNMRSRLEKDVQISIEALPVKVEEANHNEALKPTKTIQGTTLATGAQDSSQLTQQQQQQRRTAMELGYRNYLKCHVRTKKQFKNQVELIENVKLSDIIFGYFCPCSKKHRPAAQAAMNSIERLGLSLETIRIIETMNRLDKLLKILFSPDQLLLFNIIPNYELNHFNPVSDLQACNVTPEKDNGFGNKCKDAACRLFLKGAKTEVDVNILNHVFHLIDDEKVLDNKPNPPPSSTLPPPKPRASRLRSIDTESITRPQFES